MSTSCLDRSLLSSAVAGTGANVSLLIYALTPLCPKPTPPVDIAANHIGTVVTGYVCGFLPWGFVALFDFISAKWRTVGDTRRAGRVHIVASVVPMIVVIAYAVLQALSGDYKEMMTAVIAIALTVYHIARTLWGLVQLEEYVKWCRYTLQCVRATRPKMWLWYNFTSIDGEEDEDEDLYSKLMVNEDIVDNEFNGRDVSVKLSWPNGEFQVSNSEVCSVRWSAAFLCSLGEVWKCPDSKSIPRDLMSFVRLSHLHLDDLCSQLPSTSFWHLSRTCDRQNCGAFGSTIHEYQMDSNAFANFTFEFDSIVSSYPPRNESEFPSEQNRKDARIELVQYIMATSMIGPQKLLSISSQSLKLYAELACLEQADDAFQLLQNQVELEENIELEEVDWLCKLAMAPPRKVKPNSFILAPFLARYNRTAFDIGHVIRESTAIEENEHGDRDVFQICLTILEEKQPIFLRADRCYFLGVSLDSVRTYLANWVLLRNGNPDSASWCPTIRMDSITFVSSDPEYTFSVQRYNVISECQDAMHQRLAVLDLSIGNVPASPALIALFLLPYPSLHVEFPESEVDDVELPNETFKCKIKPVLAPQSILLSLVVNKSTKNSSLQIVGEHDNMRFEWECWINSAMELLKAENQFRKSQRTDAFVGPLDLIKKADLSRPMLTLNHSDQDQVLSSPPGQIHVWTAWPMFDVRFCQCMEGCNTLPDNFTIDDGDIQASSTLSDEAIVDNEGTQSRNNSYYWFIEYRQQKDTAMKTLTEILSWDRT